MGLPDSLELDPVSRESTASMIASLLRQAIMDGSLPPGTQMGEAALAARLNVSRGPLREAMQRLVQEGLLRSELHRGLFVMELGPGDVRDVYRVRLAIEGAAIQEIMAGDWRATAGRLAAVHDQMVLAAQAGDSAALSTADLRFHELLVAESGSPRLARMCATLLVETRMCITALQDKYTAPADLAAEHGQIVAAIEAGDVRVALDEIDVHMRDAVRRLAPGT